MIHKVACQLFVELWDGTPIRNLGVQTSKVVANESARQLNLFDRMRKKKNWIRQLIVFVIDMVHQLSREPAWLNGGRKQKNKVDTLILV